MRSFVRALLVLAVARPLIAQTGATAPGPVLSLQEAIDLARRNNPAHQQTKSLEDRASAQVRSAYGALLPSLRSSFNGSYREGRPEIVAGQAFGSTSDLLSSSSSLDLFAQYSFSSLNAPRVQRANRAAAQADVANSDALLQSTIVGLYLNVLQSKARAVLQDTLLANTQAQLELARARAAAGAATTLDVRRAEVAVGQQQVQVLTERNNVEINLLRLFQQVGVPQPENVQLVTNFPVEEPKLELNALLGMARAQNPALEASRARERASNVAMSQARSLYTPTLSLSTSLAGNTTHATNFGNLVNDRIAQGQEAYASCLAQDSLFSKIGFPSNAANCDRQLYTPQEISRDRAANDKWPFGMTRNPLGFTIGLSFPIFDGFQREQRVQNAAADRNDARYAVRARELQLTADVTAYHKTLLTAYQTVRLQEQNAQTARQALDLAQERFRVGAATFVDVTQARADFERASTDHINAIYEYHRAYAVLESAVGKKLR
jgi:outer membrane protein